MIVHEPVSGNHSQLNRRQSRDRFPDRDILDFVTKVRRRQRKILIVKHSIVALAAGFLAAFIMGAVSLAEPFYYAVPAGLVIIAVSLAAGIVIGIIRTPSIEKAALLADEKGLRERVVTAISLRGRQDYFSMLQKKNTVAVIAGFSVTKYFPLTVNKKAAALLVFSCTAFLIVSALPSASKEQARAMQEIIQEAEAEIEKAEDIIREVKAIPEISLAEQEVLTDMLNEVTEELQEARTGEELKKAEERFQKKLETAIETTDNEELSQALKEHLNADLKKDTQSYEGDFEQVKQALKEAADGSQESLEEAAQKMEELAQLLDDRELMEAAGELRISEGTIEDIEAAELILAEASERSSEKGQSDGGQEDSDGDTIADGQDGNQDSDGDAIAGSQDSDGDAIADSQGSDGQNGDGLSGLISAGQSGSDDRYDSEENIPRISGEGWDKGSTASQEGAAKSPQEMITVPGAAVGDDENLTGKQNESDQSYLQESDQSLTWSGEKVDYNQVKSEYSERAYEKLDGSNYPGEVKEQIKTYFEEINQ